MTNKEIIKAISNQTQIHIPLSRGYKNFSKGRLICHFSYWISIATLKKGRYSKKFLNFWKNQADGYHYDILELFGIDINSYKFEHPDSTLDLGIS